MNWTCAVALSAMVVAGLVGCEGSDDETAKQTADSGASADGGVACTGPSDPACGAAKVCVYGFCRVPCTKDMECPQGGVCLGAGPPFGCSVQSELDCKTNPETCQPPLVCGLDSKCRATCTKDTDCPRNEQVCSGGTCITGAAADQ